MTMLEYHQLKDDVVISVGRSERHSQMFAELKALYKDEINSDRRHERINTIGQLLTVLEVRDVLSEDNVEPLKLIARKLPNCNELLKRIRQYEELHVPREYICYYALDNTRSASNRAPNANPYSTIMSKTKKDRIYDAVIEKIGNFWRELGRNLKIPEGKLDDINRKHEKLRDKATELLEEYDRRAEPQRQFFGLCAALEKSRRRDLSLSVQDIMTWNI